VGGPISANYQLKKKAVFLLTYHQTKDKEEIDLTAWLDAAFPVGIFSLALSLFFCCAHQISKSD
jgi:hypothetical protein